MPIPLVIILNLVLVIAVVSGIVGLLGWSIVAQDRDHPAGSAERIRRQPQPAASPRFAQLGAGGRRMAS